MKTIVCVMITVSAFELLWFSVYVLPVMTRPVVIQMKMLFG